MPRITLLGFLPLFGLYIISVYLFELCKIKNTTQNNGVDTVR